MFTERDDCGGGGMSVVVVEGFEVFGELEGRVDLGCGVRDWTWV